MKGNKESKITKQGEKSLREISKVAKKAIREGSTEYKNFIDKHRKSLKKLADR